MGYYQDTVVPLVLLVRHFDMPATHAPDHEEGSSHFLSDRLVVAAAAS